MTEAAELVPTTGMGDGEIQPTKKYSSENVVAATELTFKAKNKAEAIKAQVKEGKLSKKEAKEEYKKAYTTIMHTIDKNEVEKELETNFDTGLTSEAYKRMLTKYGPNSLTPPKHDPWWLRLLKSVFGGFFNILLWIGSVLCFIAYGVDASENDIPDQTNLYLGVVLAVVVTLSGLFSYYQEGKSADLMASLQAMNKASKVDVLRDGVSKAVEPEELVPGDVVNIISGQAIPADVRVISCTEDMEVNNASLTGEADPLKRDWRPDPEDMAPLESKNLMFFGTNLINGSGRCVVFHTGDNTFMGRTAALTVSTEGEETPIAKEIKDFVKKVSVIAFLLGIIFFIIGYVDNQDVIRNIIFLIGIIVANVPEGLLATVTVSLTLTARRMYTKNVRVKNLESVETLGSTSVICSDKTGTLTTSIMTCQHVYFNMSEKLADTTNPYSAVAGDFYDANERRSTDFLRLVRCGALCNNADFVQNPGKADHGTVQPNANPTEAAMVKFTVGHISGEYRFTVPKYREKHKKLHEIPFNSTNKWQISVHELQPDYQIGTADEKKQENTVKVPLVQFKGAPERVLSYCDKYWLNGELRDLTEEAQNEIMNGVLALGGRGERVLALAELELDMKEYDINVDEPQQSNFKLETEDVGGRDMVIVMWNDERLEVDLSNVRNDEGDAVPFEECVVRHIGMSVAEQVRLKYDQIRLFYGSEPRLAGDETFKALNVERGSVFHAFIGPYTFKGKNADTVNWPFKRQIPGTNEREPGLHFIGLFAFMDPPRAGVRDAVEKCQSAGIRVIMVTGDHPVTAAAIAKDVRIIRDGGRTKKEVADEKYGGDESQVQGSEYSAVVVPGWDLQKYLDIEGEEPQKTADFWNDTLKHPDVVFARTSPQQKLLIVRAVQERGGIVAVTGDGVNDSPALKKADIGVAMGITGTDVAKEAADMILLDDNFASIVNGVEEGRIIFDNLKKSIAYTLSSNIPEIAPFLFYQTMGIPLPLTTVMILLVDLGTDLAPAISMAYEGKEANIMDRPPRNPLTDKLVTWKLISFSYLQIGILQAIAGFYAYFVVLQSFGIFYSYTPGMDKYRVFETSPRLEVNRDGYWMWCEKDTTTCIYTPEFSFSWASDNIKTSQKDCAPSASDPASRCGYFQESFVNWQIHVEKDNEGFRTNAKNYIYNTCQVNNLCPEITLNLLNGGVEAGKVLIWNNEENVDALTCYTAAAPSPDCKPVLGDRTTVPSGVTGTIIFQDIWEQKLEPVFRSKQLISDKYPNRLCFLDASDTFTPAIVGKFPATCDYITYPVNENHRTYVYLPNATSGHVAYNNVADRRQYSLFPMTSTTRTEAVRRANTAYFISIIVVQWADLMICKTRVRSLFEQGMTNTFMNFALIFETVLGATLAYLPLEQIIGTRRMRFVWWNAAIPFSLAIYIYDELRKGFIRGHEGSWLHRNTYW